MQVSDNFNEMIRTVLLKRLHKITERKHHTNMTSTKTHSVIVVNEMKSPKKGREKKNLYLPDTPFPATAGARLNVVATHLALGLARLSLLTVLCSFSLSLSL